MLSRGIAHFEYSSLIPASVEEVWTFHERPDALERLTPPDRRVQILLRHGGLQTGAEVVMRMKLFGPISATWTAQHTGYKRHEYFIDELRAGPFHFWRHKHLFAPTAKGMQLTDSIDFQAPLAPLSEWFVRRQLQQLFAWRHAVTRAAVAGKSA